MVFPPVVRLVFCARNLVKVRAEADARLAGIARLEHGTVTGVEVDDIGGFVWLLRAGFLCDKEDWFMLSSSLFPYPFFHLFFALISSEGIAARQTHSEASTDEPPSSHSPDQVRVSPRRKEIGRCKDLLSNPLRAQNLKPKRWACRVGPGRLPRY